MCIWYEFGDNMTEKKSLYKYAHSPTLNTVLMVEETLRNSGEILKISELKRKLPRKVMHDTLLRILDYLQMSGKILISVKGIVWIFSPDERLRNAIAKGVEH